MKEEHMPAISHQLHGEIILWNGSLQLSAFAAEFACHLREPMP
jgi:hypothetical protein